MQPIEFSSETFIISMGLNSELLRIKNNNEIMEAFFTCFD